MRRADNDEENSAEVAREKSDKDVSAEAERITRRMHADARWLLAGRGKKFGNDE